MKTSMAQAQSRWQTAGPHPNGLHAAPDALWIIDQGDGRLYAHHYDTGDVLQAIPTDADKASGLTFDGTNFWIASTYNCLLLKVDQQGKTLASFDTPGAGVVPWRTGTDQPRTGAHGLEWRDGHLWVATPPSGTIYEVDPTDGHVIRSFRGPGFRPHGIAWQGDDLWCVETNDRALYRYRIATGEAIERLNIDGPIPHGMTIHDGQFWYCDADTRSVATLPLP